MIKLDEQRKAEKTGNGFGLSEDEDETLGGFIVFGSEDESISSRGTGNSSKGSNSKGSSRKVSSSKGSRARGMGQGW